MVINALLIKNMHQMTVSIFYNKLAAVILSHQSMASFMFSNKINFANKSYQVLKLSYWPVHHLSKHHKPAHFF